MALVFQLLLIIMFQIKNLWPCWVLVPDLWPEGVGDLGGDHQHGGGQVQLPTTATTLQQLQQGDQRLLRFPVLPELSAKGRFQRKEKKLMEFSIKQSWLGGSSMAVLSIKKNYGLKTLLFHL